MSLSRIAGLGAWAVLGVSVVSAVAQAQLSAFEYQPSRDVRSHVFHFTKSELDGSHAGRVSVYVDPDGHIQSLKPWDEPVTRATLIEARMNWPRLSVARFEGWELNCDQPPQRRATLESSADGRELRISTQAQPFAVEHWPWHSYDFDLVSLSLSLPHLKDPRATFSFRRLDFVFGEEMRFADLGDVSMRFEREEARLGRTAWRYVIGGDGLKGKEGTWWSDAGTGRLLEFEIPLGDEPGFNGVRLRLEDAGPMTPAGWADYKRAAVCTRD